jgi:tetratricopeptide (TPR) repeat protein
METAGEERVRAVQTLCRLEDAGVLLKEASTSVPVTELSPDFPKEVSAILNELTTLSSRDDAERLLATGVSMWNSVLNLEVLSNASQTEALVKVRHVAADCIYMAITVLSGVSAQYNIDEITLLKFYTTCGQKYVSELGDMDMAALCFAKAAEFSKSAEAVAAETDGGKRALAKALFDLAIGSAECAWEQHDAANAEKLVFDASQHLQDLPEECEYLASVQFNFGLFAYRSKDYERALVWLQRSIATRALPRNPVMNASKQARALRLAGFCSLSLKDYDRALETLQEAESMCHDPLGAYLLLKLSVLTRSPRVVSLVKQIIEDRETNLELCMGSLALLTEAQMLEAAKAGYQDLRARFHKNTIALSCTIGPRYFDVLCSLNYVEEAAAILRDSSTAIGSLVSADLESRDITSKERGNMTLQQRQIQEYNKWTNLALHAATVFLDRKEYKTAATFVEHSLLLAESVRVHIREDAASTHSAEPGRTSTTTCDDIENVVLENEAHVCRLSAACALCALSMSDLSLPLSKLETLSATDSSLLRQAARSAERAKEIDPDDLAARLLIFRVFLVKGDTARAASEMERAAHEVHEFDVGALAEAACEARDIGSKRSILAVLRCILQAHTVAHERSATEPLIDGFLGTVLVSAISMQCEQEIPGSNSNGNETNVPKLGRYVQDEARALMETLRIGLTALSSVGILKAFGDGPKADAALSYLSDVAWNLGCQAKVEDCYEHMAEFFELCYGYCRNRSETTEIIRYLRSAKLLVRWVNVASLHATFQFELAFEQFLDSSFLRALGMLTVQYSMCGVYV